MAKLPQFKRIVREDFKDQPWIEKLLQPLNRFMESVVSALNKQLTFKENMAAQVHEFDFTEDNITYPLKVAWGLKTLPTDMIVTRVVVADGSNPSAAVWPLWSYDGTSINVSKFYGLDASTRYKIRTIIFSG